MASLRFDAEQRFTCRQCGRCCRRAWDIALTPGEVEAYRKADLARLYREREDAPEGAEHDPLEPIPGHAPHFRIRKRADGACGFLSPENRCRIHEELGASRKPLTCRLFPYRFHPADKPSLVTLSFCCPTVVANAGTPLSAQLGDLVRLEKEWRREYPEPAGERAFAPGRPVAGATLGTLRGILREMLDRPGGAGPPELRSSVARMAAWLADLTRHRVLRLAERDFAEYLALTGRFAARTEKPAGPRAPSRLTRVLFRGFLFVIAAARLQVDDPRRSGLRLALRWRLGRLLLHFHGLGPAVAGYDLGAARRARVRLEDPTLAGLARNYLRALVETLGAGGRSAVDELAVGVAFLSAALELAAMRAARAGRVEADAADLSEGLMDAVDLSHVEPGGALDRILSALAGGVGALELFAAGRASDRGPAAQRANAEE